MLAGGRFAGSRFSLSRFNRGRFGIQGGGTDYSENGFDPGLVLDYPSDYFRTGGASVADPVDYGTLGLATLVDSTGTVVWNAKDGNGDWYGLGDTLPGSPTYLPRIGHHIYDSAGSEWVNAGLLTEPSADTNLLLNTETLSTQDVTVTNVAHTLHFTGTGTVTLSGTSTDGPLVGTGTGEENRVSLTFTPTAGTLTLTVSGTVSLAHLSTGETVRSYVPCADFQITRAADPVPEIAYAALPLDGGAVPAAVSIGMEGYMTYADEGVGINSSGTDAQLFFTRWHLNNSNHMINAIGTVGSDIGQYAAMQEVLGVNDYSNTSGNAYTPGQNVPFNIASYHKADGINCAHEGTLLIENITPTALANLSTTNFQFATTGDQIMTKVLRIWGEDIGDDGLTTATGGTV